MLVKVRKSLTIDGVAVFKESVKEHDDKEDGNDGYRRHSTTTYEDLFERAGFHFEKQDELKFEDKEMSVDYCTDVYWKLTLKTSQPIETLSPT